MSVHLFDGWFDRESSSKNLIRYELNEMLARARFEHKARLTPTAPEALPIHRYWSRTCSLMGTSGMTEITIPRTRLEAPNGKTTHGRICTPCRSASHRLLPTSRWRRIKKLT